MSKKVTRETFVNKCHAFYGREKYNYDDVVYVDCETRVMITCNDCHEGLYVLPTQHSTGNGKKCKCFRIPWSDFQINREDPMSVAEENRKTMRKKSIEVYGKEFYNYDDSVYIDGKTPMEIVCPDHGKFKTKPDRHFRKNDNRCGCKGCSGDKIADALTMTQEEFIRRGKVRFGDKIDYSRLKYLGIKEAVELLCNDCNTSFFARPDQFLSGKYGCPTCAYKITAQERRRTTDEYISLATVKHSGYYRYPNLIYVMSKEDVEIECPIHGPFWQAAVSHLRGHGCPFCKSSRGELLINKILTEFGVSNKPQATFDGCVHNIKLRYDFYLTDHNICVEYDGIQHYQPVEHFGGDKEFVDRMVNDAIKTKFCEDNNIPLIRVRYDEPDIRSYLLGELRKYIPDLEDSNQ